MEMSAEEIKKIAQDAVAPWKDKDGNLIMVLHQIQNKLSYVPRQVSFEVARLLKIPLARIYEVITFYNYFKLEPPGKNVISVCMGTACYLKGAKAITDTLVDKLGIKLGETTPDKNFHLQEVRCLGCCGQAPVLTVGHKIYGRLTTEQVSGIVDEYAADAAAPAEEKA
jgi:NADH-quinone oxidoreductase subunit E